MEILRHIFQAENYYLNPYFIPPFITANLVLILGFFVFSLEKKSSFNRSFLYLCLSAAVWLYAGAMVFNTGEREAALFWSRILFGGFVFIPSAIFHISVAYTERYKDERRVVFFAYGISFVFIFLTWSRYFLSGVRECFFGYYPDSGILLSVFLLFMLFFPALGMVNLINYYHQSKDVSEQKRTKYLILAFIFTLISYIDILPSYGLQIFPCGYLAVLGFVLVIAYSMIKYHNLMAEHHAEELEKKVQEKTAEINHILTELRATQLKLFETGKISALASLSAGILHQLSQPITAIHGFTKFIKKEMKETDPFYKAIVIMDEQSVYIKEMLEDLMNLVRHREIRKENIDINKSLKRALNLLNDELRIRRVDWDIILDDNLPPVHADAVHLQQVFMNIVVNAIQAMEELPKGVRKHIKITSRFDKDVNKVIIFFEDTGPGISEETQRQIFEPFFTTKTRGSGIGLALCKDLIIEHGGEIHIVSHPGQGATFVIQLPPAAN